MARMKKSVAEGFLGSVPPDKRFWSRNGQAYENLEQLQSGLASMDEETYRYHASDSKNDFSSWVRDVISDGKLAHDLEKSENAVQAARRVADRVSFLKERAEG